jgi:sporulation integral membrane protein YlbJ
MAIAGAHYVSSILLGLIMRFYGRKDEKLYDVQVEKEGNIFVRSIESLFQAREEDGRPIGELLGDSVKESVNTLLLIGGYIILFSVLTRILTEVGIVLVLTKIIATILSPLGIAETLVMPIIGGLFEITNGANLAANAVAPLFQRVMICSAIIAWSGFSVHAQVSTMVRGTDIRVGTYVFARVLHGILAALCTFLFLSPSFSVFLPLAKLTAPFNESVFSLGFIDRFGYLAYNFLVILGLMLLVSVVIAFIRRVKIIIMRV